MENMTVLRTRKQMDMAARAYCDLEGAHFRHKDIVMKALRFFMQEFGREDFYMNESPFENETTRFIEGNNKCLDTLEKYGIIIFSE